MKVDKHRGIQSSVLMRAKLFLMILSKLLDQAIPEIDLQTFLMEANKYLFSVSPS